MLARPRLRPRFRSALVPADGVYLLSEAGDFLLRGELYARLVPLLTGAHAPAELADRLAPVASRAEVYYALVQLERRGYLDDAPPPAEPASAAFWDMAGAPPDAAARPTRVVVRALGDADPGPLRVALGAAGVDEVAVDPSLTIVVVADYLDGALAAIDADMRERGAPWMLVREAGAEVWVGPLLVPGRTGCWTCMAARLRLVRPVVGYVADRLGSARASFPAHAATASSRALAAALAAHAAAQWSGHREGCPLVGALVTLDAIRLTQARHPLIRRPQCSACGRPQVPAYPPALAPAPRGDDERSVSPEAFVEAHRHHVGSVLGVIASLRRVGSPDGPRHAYAAGTNSALPRGDLAALRRSLRSESSGKGRTDVEARASAIAEALERHSGGFQGDEPARLARLAELDDAVDPAALLHFSRAQYAARSQWNADPRRFERVPEPFDRDAPTLWSPAWSLTHARARSLPTAYCYYDVPHGEGPAFCVADSNGCAAGATPVEAIVQGALELCERDAVAIWWYNRLRRPGVDLDTWPDDHVRSLRRWYAARGRSLWALDLTHDLGLPTYVALSAREDGPEERIMLGFGCHLDPWRALSRAVTELGQFVDEAEPTHDEARARLDPRTDAWVRTARRADLPYLVPDLAAPRAAAAAYTREPDARGDLAHLRAVLEPRGLELIVLDQTRADIGLPVVKVVIPGLRHFWPRYAPGRLYDVPVALGWLAAPTPEAALNPTDMFL
jgi:bacteriocin biosynthesis cyclodehydratase domain-containing protein